MSDQRRPIHLAVLVGLSASAYAGSLAVVTTFQSTTDATVSAAREPIRAAADVIAAGHDELEALVVDAARRYGLLGDQYGALLPEFTQVETSLDALATSTAKVSNSAQALPTRVSLPKLVSAPRITRVAAPTSHATTGASGG
jgi:hypothetical protein